MTYYDDGLPYSEMYIEKIIPPVLRIARVIKVYPLDMCADIAYPHSLDLGFSGSSTGKSGLYAYRVPILSSFAGAFGYEDWLENESSDKEHVAYGSFCSVRAGDYVVVGFIDNDFTRPVILGSLHYFYRDENITGKTRDFLDEQGPSENGVTEEDEERYITVYPSMVWTRVNKLGELEISFPLGKGANTYRGFFIKVGRHDPVSEAKGIVDSIVKAKERVEELQKASDILNIPEVLDVVSKIKNGTISFERGIEEILANKEVQKIFSGDPHMEEDYGDGGCYCGATTSSRCTCGAGWGTCPNCSAAASGCPYKRNWTCPNCGSVVPNTRYGGSLG